MVAPCSTLLGGCTKLIDCTCRLLKTVVSVIGPFIVIAAGLLVPEYEPLPLPVQPPNAYPLFAVALMFTTALLFCQLLSGLTLPPAPAFIVR